MFLVSVFWEQKMFKINFLIPTLNKESQTAEKGRSSSLRFGPEANNSSPQKNQRHKRLHRALDRSFGMTRSLKTVARELGKYMLHFVPAWDVRWDKGANELIKIILFSVDMEIKIINQAHY
jgi:hypothetical protein